MTDLNLILLKLCEIYKIPLTTILKKNRKREIVDIRKLYSYFAKKFTSQTWNKIAQVIEKKHDIFIYYYQTVNDRMQIDKEFREHILYVIEPQIKSVLQIKNEYDYNEVIY